MGGGKLFNSRNELIKELDIMYPEEPVTSTSCKEEIFSIQYDIGDSERPTKIFFAISPTDNCTKIVEESVTVVTEFIDQGKDKLMAAVQYVRASDEDLEGEQLMQTGLPIFGIASCSAMIVIIFSLIGLIVFVRVKKKREEVNINTILSTYRPHQSFNSSSEDHGSYGRYTTTTSDYDNLGQQSFYSSSISHRSEEGEEGEEEFVGDVVAIVDNILYYHVGPIEVTER